MTTKPFCLAVGRDWTLTPSKTDLREIHTELNLNRIHRGTHGITKNRLKNITAILSEKHLQDSGPVRILVEGTCVMLFKSRTNKY